MNKVAETGLISNNTAIASEMLEFLQHKILEKWYPLVIDKECGGYFTNISHDWKIEPDQEKMIVSQARHIWTTSKVANFLDNDKYLYYAIHGYEFLKNKMWDEEFGGFFQMRSREGELSDVRGYLDEKRTYGNAFSVYALASLYELTKRKDILIFALLVFDWIEKHTFDKKLGGYHQFITREGEIFGKGYDTNASDIDEVGYKDQNSSIHLLEAYTELYNVHKDEKVQKQLTRLLNLIRDVMTNPKGYLHLFFENDLTPVSFAGSSEEIRKKNYGLDHVSFGHDYETAFLMLEASYVLGLQNDFKTLSVAKRMLDHAIENGFDNSIGGFYDGGYYFAGSDKCSIVKDTKNWWAQAEALNALLIFSKIFPENDIYVEVFLKQWDYVKNYIMDYENGDWFEGGIDKEPHFKFGPRSHMWKCTYHTGRAMMNCIKMLTDSEFEMYSVNPRFKHQKDDFDKFIEHWRTTAKSR